MPDVVITVTVGGTIVHRNSFDPEAWAEACKKHDRGNRDKTKKIHEPAHKMAATGPDYGKAAAELLAPAVEAKAKSKKAAKK